MRDLTQKFLFRLKWLSMSERGRYAYLWARTRRRCKCREKLIIISIKALEVIKTIPGLFIFYPSTFSILQRLSSLSCLLHPNRLPGRNCWDF